MLKQYTPAMAALIDHIFKVCPYQPPYYVIALTPLQNSTAELALVHDDDLTDLLQVCET